MSRDHRRHPLGIAAIAVIAAVLSVTGACRRQQPPVRTTLQRVPAGPGEKPWFAGTEKTQGEIRALMASVPESSAMERVTIGRRIVAYGEPAVPILIDGLRSGDSTTRGTSAWLLGFLGDPRSANALARAANDPVAHVGYEASLSLLRMRDDRGLRRLVDGLQDTDVRARSKCSMALEEHTGDTFGYRPDDAPGDRAAAVARWRAWLASRPGRPGE